MAQTLHKKEDDAVKLVNKTDQERTFVFNATSYTIPAKSSQIVKRHLADHAILKCRVVTAGSIIYPLAIEEVDNPRMNDNDISLTRINEIKDLKNEIAENKETISRLEQENKELISKISDLNDRIKNRAK